MGIVRLEEMLGFVGGQARCSQLWTKLTFPRKLDFISPPLCGLYQVYVLCSHDLLAQNPRLARKALQLYQLHIIRFDDLAV